MSEGVCIQVQGVKMRYPKASQDTLKGIDFSVNNRDVFGLLGPNGAGKTTLISILCGVFEPTDGQVTFSALGPDDNIKQQIGFVPQEYAFYEQLSPLQNLAYFGALYNLKALEIKERSHHLLEVLGLSSVAKKKVGKFSGGMKRRVNLAIGLLHQPKILFLDEPTVGVDVQSKHAIIKFLNEINAEGTTIIYTSHHLAEAQEICNRIALIDHGSIIACDRLDVLLKKHNTTDLQQLFIDLTGEGYRD